MKSVEELIERLRSHMGRQEVPILLKDCGIAADKLEELAAKYEVLLQCYEGCSHLREQAEVALAEKDKEIAALHSLVRQAKGWVADHAWQWHEKADQTLDHNAGGKDANE